MYFLGKKIEASIGIYNINNIKTNITNLSGRTGWDFRMWLLAVVTGWPL